MKNTSESWLETMDTKKGYFINHVDEAQSFIEKITNEKTAQIPYPMDSSDKSYYITISGKVFFAKTISGKGFVIQKGQTNCDDCKFKSLCYDANIELVHLLKCNVYDLNSITEVERQK